MKITVATRGENSSVSNFVKSRSISFSLNGVSRKRASAFAVLGFAVVGLAVPGCGRHFMCASKRSFHICFIKYLYNRYALRNYSYPKMTWSHYLYFINKINHFDSHL